MLEYGLQTGSVASVFVGFRRMAAGRITAGFVAAAVNFSFWLRSVSGSGEWRRMDNVKLPCVTVNGGEEEFTTCGGLSGSSFLISTSIKFELCDVE